MYIPEGEFWACKGRQQYAWTRHASSGVAPHGRPWIYQTGGRWCQLGKSSLPACLPDPVHPSLPSHQMPGLSHTCNKYTSSISSKKDICS